MQNLIICNDDGDELPISSEALLIQGVALGVFRDGDKASLHILGNVLKRVEDLLNALYELSKDKTNPANLEQYKAAKRACECDVLWYGKRIHNSTQTAVQGELFADAAT